MRFTVSAFALLAAQVALGQPAAKDSPALPRLSPEKVQQLCKSGPGVYNAIRPNGQLRACYVVATATVWKAHPNQGRARSMAQTAAQVRAYSILAQHLRGAKVQGTEKVTTGSKVKTEQKVAGKTTSDTTNVTDCDGVSTTFELKSGGRVVGQLQPAATHMLPDGTLVRIFAFRVHSQPAAKRK